MLNFSLHTANSLTHAPLHIFHVFSNPSRQMGWNCLVPTAQLKAAGVPHELVPGPGHVCLMQDVDRGDMPHYTFLLVGAPQDHVFWQVRLSTTTGGGR